jgi:hypothetical protein
MILNRKPSVSVKLLNINARRRFANYCYKSRQWLKSGGKPQLLCSSNTHMER